MLIIFPSHTDNTEGLRESLSKDRGTCPACDEGDGEEGARTRKESTAEESR